MNEVNGALANQGMLVEQQLETESRESSSYEWASAASERSLFNITEKSQYERPGPTRPGLKRFSEAHISATAGPIDLRSSSLGSPIPSTP